MILQKTEFEKEEQSLLSGKIENLAGFNCKDEHQYCYQRKVFHKDNLLNGTLMGHMY